MKNKTNTTRDALQLLGFRVTERADGKFRVARSGAAVILGRLELCHPVDVMNLWADAYHLARADKAWKQFCKGQ